jgi:hypothetical protein
MQPAEELTAVQPLASASKISVSCHERVNDVACNHRQSRRLTRDDPNRPNAASERLELVEQLARTNRSDERFTPWSFLDSAQRSTANQVQRIDAILFAERRFALSEIHLARRIGDGSPRRLRELREKRGRTDEG